MTAADDDEPLVEVVISSQRPDDNYRLVGDPEVLPDSGADWLAHGIAEAGAAITEVRRATGYENDGLPSGGNSLWWPDGTAQVVQATDVDPKTVGEFLIAQIGHDRRHLRIVSVLERSPSHFIAHGKLHLRGTGWRNIALTVYPTPSANLTVIEMMPRRAWMPQTTRYLAAGVPAITELKDAIEAANELS